MLKRRPIWEPLNPLMSTVRIEIERLRFGHVKKRGLLRVSRPLLILLQIIWQSQRESNPRALLEMYLSSSSATEI